MTEFETQVLKRLDRIEDGQHAQRLAFGALDSALKERCPNHHQQITDLWTRIGELRKRNGDASSVRGISKILLALISLASLLAGGLVSLLAHHMGAR